MNANETTGSIGRMWKKTTEGESSCGKAIVPCIADSECQAFCSVPATRMSRPHHVYLCPSCPPCSPCPPFLTCPPSITCPPCSQCPSCLPCPTFPPCAPGLRPLPSKVPSMCKYFLSYTSLTFIANISYMTISPCYCPVSIAPANNLGHDNDMIW